MRYSANEFESDVFSAITEEEMLDINKIQKFVDNIEGLSPDTKAEVDKRDPFKVYIFDSQMGEKFYQQDEDGKVTTDVEFKNKIEQTLNNLLKAFPEIKSLELASHDTGEIFVEIKS